MAMANKEEKQTAPVVLYPVKEVVEKAEELFHVPNYVAGAALSDLEEVDVNTAQKKITAFLNREVK
ncbi:hypothetical protein [Bacillus paranthracis]|uniref:hypothetical protein n=1 Tax=Bacillus paranthracis TaxID=2026186 RepID=UPI0020B7C9E2|nr:hypothetical protein MON10_11445 [Bacillus paranthracis]